MKRLLLSVVVVCFALAGLAGQDPVFLKGDKVLNLGLGLGSTWYSGTYYTATVPPLSASFEFGVADNIAEKGSIGVGPYLGFSAYKWEYSSSGYKYSNLIFGARGNFHYPLVEKLDTYAGLLLAYNIVNATEFGTPTGTNSISSGIRSAIYVGARYYFKDTFAVMGELGYGVTYLNLGVAFKF